MILKFRFRKEVSHLFGSIYRPVAKVSLWSTKFQIWDTIWMIVDTGADYTLLPKYLASDLGIQIESLKTYTTLGIGGGEIVYFLPKIKAKIGTWKRDIPVGFLKRDDIPPLLGRHLFLETFEVLLSSNHTITFSSK